MNKFLNINDRILYIIENQCNKNQKKFADLIGFSPQVVGNIVSGRKNKPSFDVLFAILSSFADIEADWLILGKEPMFKKDKFIIDEPNPIRDKLIATQSDFIEELQRRLKELEKEISELKKAKENSSGYGMVAESKQELKSK